MEKSTQPSLIKNDLKARPSGLRGFTLQLFLFIVLPLTVLVLVVAFGSQALHHEAMRSLVGDRDLKTVQAAASTLEREISHVSSTLLVLSRSSNGKSDFESLILTPEEISITFDGGISLYSTDGSLIRSSSTKVDWKRLPVQIPGLFKNESGGAIPIFSRLIH
ncbi:MAG: hypothetical protein Q8O06_08580, partial [Acetobacterium sp.]|nr:hypothetical protein [Acetobacterium sp.]